MFAVLHREFVLRWLTGVDDGLAEIVCLDQQCFVPSVGFVFSVTKKTSGVYFVIMAENFGAEGGWNFGVHFDGKLRGGATHVQRTPSRNSGPTVQFLQTIHCVTFFNYHHQILY